MQTLHDPTFSCSLKIPELHVYVTDTCSLHLFMLSIFKKKLNCAKMNGTGNYFTVIAIIVLAAKKQVTYDVITRDNGGRAPLNKQFGV